MKRDRIGLALTLLLTTIWPACARSTREAVKPSAPAAGSPASGSPSSSSSSCAPLETRAANARHQRPAFAGQTRACGVKSGAAFEVTVLAKGLERPWAVEHGARGGGSPALLMTRDFSGRLQ